MGYGLLDVDYHIDLGVNIKRHATFKDSDGGTCSSPSPISPISRHGPMVTGIIGDGLE